MGFPAIRWSRLLDAIIKIVSIDFLHRIHGYSRYTNIMLDHQTGELLPIDQDNFAPNLRNITSSIVAKSGSRNEYPPEESKNWYPGGYQTGRANGSDPTASHLRSPALINPFV
jgi:hypothetical protein